MDSTVHDRRPAPLGFFHCTLTGVAVLAVLFLLCWATSAGGEIPASRAFIRLFTETPDAPRQTLLTGFIWSLIAGGLIGGLVALCFNLIAMLPRPGRRPGRP